MNEDTNKGAVAIEEEKLDQVSAGASGAGAGKVSMNDAQLAGDPSQWGIAKKGSFDITE